MKPLDTILALLTERILLDGSWTVTINELEDIMDPVTLYRAVYERGLIGRDTYSPAAAGELVNLLERAAEPDAESRMREAGLFLSHDDRIDLTARFVRFVRRAIVLHVPDLEIFRGMVTHFRRYDIAEETYCATYLAMAPIIDRCAAEHAEDTQSAAVRELTAKWYLRTLVDRQIVVLSDLGPALFELLRTIGRQEGSLPRIEEDEGRRAADAEQSEHDERKAALAVLGITSSQPPRAEIQRQYRRLMRRFHPDVNPDGLEMAKRINAAYGVLLTNVDRR
jgi:DnaJ-like protein